MIYVAVGSDLQKRKKDKKHDMDILYGFVFVLWKMDISLPRSMYDG